MVSPVSVTFSAPTAKVSPEAQPAAPVPFRTESLPLMVMLRPRTTGVSAPSLARLYVPEARLIVMLVSGEALARATALCRVFKGRAAVPRLRSLPPALT